MPPLPFSNFGAGARTAVLRGEILFGEMLCLGEAALVDASRVGEEIMSLRPDELSSGDMLET